MLPEDPLQLIKTVHRSLSGNQLRADSTLYIYDGFGRLIERPNAKTKQPISKYVYDGDLLIEQVDFFPAHNDTVKNPIKFLDNGNTIFLDHARKAGESGYDTVQIAYKWVGGQTERNFESPVYSRGKSVA